MPQIFPNNTAYCNVLRSISYCTIRTVTNIHTLLTSPKMAYGMRLTENERSQALALQTACKNIFDIAHQHKKITQSNQKLFLWSRGLKEEELRQKPPQNNSKRWETAVESGIKSAVESQRAARRLALAHFSQLNADIPYREHSIMVPESQACPSVDRKTQNCPHGICSKAWENWVSVLGARCCVLTRSVQSRQTGRVLVLLVRFEE